MKFKEAWYNIVYNLLCMVFGKPKSQDELAKEFAEDFIRKYKDILERFD